MSLRAAFEEEQKRDRDRRGERDDFRGGGGGNDMGRERFRSRSPSRKTPSTHTNSDNPRLLHSRVFIGNLPSDRITRDEIHAMFIKYGEVLGVSVLKGYGFIQYDNEVDARKAVAAEHGSLLKGSVLDIKMAVEGRGGGVPKPPPREPPRGRDDFERERFMERERPPREISRDRDRGRRPPFREDDHYPMRHDRRDPLDGVCYPDPLGPQIDALVIGTEPRAKMYAELVVRRLKGTNLIAEMCVLPDDSHVVRATEAIATRGVLYLVTVNCTNEQHRSMTLSIRHGTPQEHRNMPLEDAVNLVSRNFSQYLQELREKATVFPNAAAPPPGGAGPFGQIEPPSEEISYLLNLLADNRMLSVEELTQVIGYLSQRRDSQQRAEQGRQQGNKDPARERQADLQDILGNGSSQMNQSPAAMFAQTAQSMGIPNVNYPNQPPPPSRPPPGPPPPDNNQSTSINFDNPNVQKALDDLIQSPALLRNITSMHGGGQQEQQVPGLMQQSYMPPSGQSQYSNMGGGHY